MFIFTDTQHLELRKYMLKQCHGKR